MTAAIFIIGLVLGMAAAVAPLGPVTLLVLRRSIQQDWAGAAKVGLGRVLPETVYVGLATFGAAVALREFPSAKLWIQGVGALLLLGLGGYFAFARIVDTPGDVPKSRWGDWAGFWVALLNPSLILTWSAVAALAMTTTSVDPTIPQKLVFATGVGSGIAFGYLTLIGTMRRWGQRLNATFIRAVIRTVGFGFIAAAVWNIVQVVGRL